jgi:hypothetical protein
MSAQRSVQFLTICGMVVAFVMAVPFLFLADATERCLCWLRGSRRPWQWKPPSRWSAGKTFAVLALGFMTGVFCFLILAILERSGN